MTAVLAVLAFVIAFGSIWFTSEALKRIDANNDAMLKPHLRKINAVVNANEETLKSLTRRFEKLEKQVHLLRLKADLPPELERETTAIQSGLNDAQRFTPTVSLNG
jgi:cell division protein FtsB